MSFLGPIQCYHSQVDLIWPDGTFKSPKHFCCSILAPPLKLEAFIREKSSSILATSCGFFRCINVSLGAKGTMGVKLNGHLFLFCTKSTLPFPF